MRSTAQGPYFFDPVEGPGSSGAPKLSGHFRGSRCCRKADGSFDAVTSNYVYHNISGHDKQQLLLETLRVLKKGGTFAIHDIMSQARYGDMDAFVKKLRSEGYEEVKLIDTTDGTFMGSKEASWLGLTGSTLLIGKK